ncbi:MAG: TonB-dependent receptor, partial [Chitinophagales bacterium]
MKKTIFCIYTLNILFCICCNQSFVAAQSSECSLFLSGNVTEESEQEPLAFATIYIPELHKGTVADSLGNYQIEGICAGIHTCIIQYIGYESMTQELNISNNTNQNFSLKLYEAVLGPIRVTGKKRREATTITQSSINSTELEQMKGKSLGEALMKIAGVNALQTGPTISKPIIHGLHSNRILMLNNGVRQEGQQWGAEHAPEIDPFIAEKLTIIKGAASVEYGSDAIGGVVLVEPAPLPIMKRPEGKINLVGMSNGRQGMASAQLEGRQKGGFAWRLQGTLRKTGDFHTPNYSLTNTAMRESNASVGIGYKRSFFGMEVFYSYFHTKLGILRGSHIGSLPDLEDALQREIPLFTEDFSYDIANPKQEVGHHLAKLKSYWLNQNGDKLQLQYAFQFDNRKEFDIRRGNRSEIPSLDLELQSHHFDLNFEHNNWGGLKGKIGVSSSYKRNRNNPDTGTRPLIPYYDQYGLGAFWIEQWKRENWELEAGIRYDFQHLSVKKFSLTNELLKPTFDF